MTSLLYITFFAADNDKECEAGEEQYISGTNPVQAYIVTMIVLLYMATFCHQTLLY